MKTLEERFKNNLLEFTTQADPNLHWTDFDDYSQQCAQICEEVSCDFVKFREDYVTENMVIGEEKYYRYKMDGKFYKRKELFNLFTLFINQKQ